MELPPEIRQLIHQLKENGLEVDENDPEQEPTRIPVAWINDLRVSSRQNPFEIWRGETRHSPGSPCSNEPHGAPTTCPPDARQSGVYTKLGRAQS